VRRLSAEEAITIALIIEGVVKAAIGGMVLYALFSLLSM
jgi:hypothetical protein